MNTAAFYQATGCSRTGGIPTNSAFTLYFNSDVQGALALRSLIERDQLKVDARVEQVLTEAISQQCWPQNGRCLFVVMTREFDLCDFMDYVVPYLEFIEVHRSR